jgi:Gp5 N-terminal OB domain
MDNLRYSIGREGFIWWMGVVEDRMDPDQLGRVRVRCFGWHTEDKTLIPTDALPWAHPVHSVNVPSSYTPREGDWCVGFFLDGESAQQPVILGVLTGSPKEPAKAETGFHDPAGIYPKRINESTMNRFIRGRTDGTVHETRQRTLKKGVKSIGVSWDEPAPTFAPQYPFNFSIESESGHAFELDDTKDNERVHLAHRNGSFIEWDAAGNRVQKIVKDSYTIIAGSDYVVIDGACNVTVKGNCSLKVSGVLAAEAKTITLNASGDVKIKAGGKLKLESGATTDIKASGAMKVGSGGKLSLKGKSTAVDGKSVTLGGKPSNLVKTKHGIGKIMPTGTASSPSNTGLKTPS